MYDDKNVLSELMVLNRTDLISNHGPIITCYEPWPTHNLSQLQFLNTLGILLARFLYSVFMYQLK